MNEPTQPFPQPDLEAPEADPEQGVPQSPPDAPRVHTEDAAEGPDDDSATS